MQPGAAFGHGARTGADKLDIGFGMLPRGEVGLVFAAIGQTLGVIDASILAVLVLILITLIAPPLLKVALSRQSRRAQVA